MKSYQQYNKGKEIKQLRNIYIKYIAGKQKGESNKDVLFGYISENIAEIETKEDAEEIYNNLDTLLKDRIMTKKEYDYYLSLLEEYSNGLL